MECAGRSMNTQRPAWLWLLWTPDLGRGIKDMTPDPSFGQEIHQGVRPWAPRHHFQSCSSRTERDVPWNDGGSQGYFHASGDKEGFPGLFSVTFQTRIMYLFLIILVLRDLKYHLQAETNTFNMNKRKIQVLFFYLFFKRNSKEIFWGNLAFSHL